MINVSVRLGCIAGLLIASIGAQASQLERGKALFTQDVTPACGLCHTLESAGTNGQIGPNLNDLAPTAEQIRAAVTQGVGIMPSYDGVLSAEDVEAVVRFVSESVKQ